MAELLRFHATSPDIVRINDERDVLQVFDCNGVVVAQVGWKEASSLISLRAGAAVAGE
ncbi:MAG TPA: hypothetical protein VLE53_06955 [Gemmatimonadaceae bacterium]|nr:hypothetical protein [Gemmatimonadaceae bacterium]